MKSKYDRWLTREMKTWREIGLVDTDTVTKIEGYYNERVIQESNKLGGVLGILGFILIGLGIILILAKNWDLFPRGAKVTLSFLPFLIGSLMGMIVLKKHISGWIKEAIAVFTTIGIVTAVVMSGQIYHIIAEEWMLFFIITLLTLPLIYLYDSTLTLAAYLILGSICMFMTDLIELWIKLGLGISIIGASIPYVIKWYKKDRVNIETSWSSAFIALAGFLFITSLVHDGVLLRELYIVYFILILGIDAGLYEEDVSLGTRPFAVIGNIGLYIMLFIFTFKEFWYYIDTSNVAGEYMIIIAFFLVITIGIVIGLIKLKRNFTKRIYIYLIAVIMIITFRVLGLLNPHTSSVLAILLNIFFVTLAFITLKEGINYSSQGRMNMGLLLLAAITIARFFDSEFSFLVKGIVFITCGAVFLLANFYLMKKRKKELRNV
ncbi:DUF2157 domain-containing protein [Cellulosilyticum sp. I15G10I2]|uniref:DUF2157 domain-containing protein n=1 Tax=Cellulosilyticum sp. I15G10I2 TaxID=1892843 RepID=UPI00085C2843|nr:DUF2157 domain-containing protein [Cellulosilyticum sp. I15G10I2]